MKFMFAAVLMGVCAITVNGNPMHPAPAMVNTGHSAQFRSQDSLGNYAFGYNEDHATGGTFRRETGSPGLAHGSYGLRTIDGRVRVVNYVADGHGFRANIQTNEPGVDQDQDPASVLINKANAIVAPYLTKQVASAPIAMQHSLEAPVLAKYAEPSLHAAAPIIESAPYAAAAAPASYLDHGAAPAAAMLSKYEPAAPIIDSSPLLSAYSPATKPIVAQSAPILSTDDSVYPMLNKALSAGATYANGHGSIYDASPISLGLHKK